MILHLYVECDRYRLGTPPLAPREKKAVRRGFATGHAADDPRGTPVDAQPVYRCLPSPRRSEYRYVSGRDSDLEAFSHNPSDGSLAPLAYQPST